MTGDTHPASVSADDTASHGPLASPLAGCVDSVREAYPEVTVSYDPPTRS